MRVLRNARMECEQSGAWLLVERSDRGQFTGVQFLRRTLRWHEQEILLQMERRHTIRHRARCAAWTHRLDL